MLILTTVTGDEVGIAATDAISYRIATLRRQLRT
jgi:hypothetical protein